MLVNKGIAQNKGSNLIIVNMRRQLKKQLKYNTNVKIKYQGSLLPRRFQVKDLT